MSGMTVGKITYSPDFETAHRMIDELDKGTRDWTMSIPAQPDKDVDLVLSQVLTDAEKELARLREEVENLRESAIEWKDGPPNVDTRHGPMFLIQYDGGIIYPKSPWLWNGDKFILAHADFPTVPKRYTKEGK